MWWRGQHLNDVRKGRDGRAWHFRVWHDFVDGVYIQRVFFWDADKSETGAIEFASDKALHVSRLRQSIGKVVREPRYRSLHRRPLRFPVEREYREYAPFEQL